MCFVAEPTTPGLGIKSSVNRIEILNTKSQNELDSSTQPRKAVSQVCPEKTRAKLSEPTLLRKARPKGNSRKHPMIKQYSAGYLQATDISQPWVIWLLGENFVMVNPDGRSLVIKEETLIVSSVEDAS